MKASLAGDDTQGDWPTGIDLTTLSDATSIIEDDGHLELMASGVSAEQFVATYEEVLPWDHLDSGLDKDWLWEDWQDSLDETEVEDCRWTPCFDCGVCPQMDTHIQIGPTGKKLLPLTVVK